MPKLEQYPFQSAISVNGKTYIALEEVNEMLDNLQKLGPTFQQIADATSRLKSVFADSKNETNNLLVELKEAEGNLKESLGEN